MAAAQSLADLIEQCEKSVVRIEVKSSSGDSLGSGFIVDRNGTMVTNVHVLAGAATAKAIFPNNKVFDVVGTVHLDQARDIAIARLAGAGIESIPPITVSPTVARKGDEVVALGSPHGLSFTATKGVVSAIRPASDLATDLGRKSMQGTWIQIDAALSPGNSGGPLINLAGAVVAMSTLASQGSAQNLNFGIAAGDILDAIRVSSTAPLVPLPSGAGKIVIRERDRGEGGGIVEPKEVPDSVIKQYAESGRVEFKSLLREMRLETERLKADLKQMRVGETFIPPGAAEPEVEIVRVTTPSRKSRIWYFRSESIKRREVSSADSRVKELTRLSTELKDPADNRTLLSLLSNYGPRLDARRNNSIGFMTDAIVLHAFNDHDAMILYNDVPYLIYMESTAGLALGQEVAPTPVFVAGTATAAIKGGSTRSFTVLQTVTTQELEESILGSGASTSVPSPGGPPGVGAPSPSVAGGTAASGGDALTSTGAAVPRDGLYSPPAASNARMWYDRTGSFSVEAILLAADEKTVTLRKIDGKVIKVPRAMLSDADQKYLKQ